MGTRRKSAIRPVRIFLPRNKFEVWAVPPYDMRFQDGRFWKRVAKQVGKAPSCLALSFSHGEEPSEEAISRIQDTMYQYLEEETLERFRRGVILTERKQGGKVRHGIVAAVDLEAYSYDPAKRSPIHAACPPRPYSAALALRENAVLEFPHTVVFYRDRRNTAWDALRSLTKDQVYEFDLMEDGGHICGYHVDGEAAMSVLTKKFGMGDPHFIVGEDEEALACAKDHWERVKKGLSRSACADHPARYALVELVSLYDASVKLLPVHRAVKTADREAFCAYFQEKVPCRREGALLFAPALPEGADWYLSADKAIDEFLSQNGGMVEYCDDRKSLRSAMGADGVGILCPQISKKELVSRLCNAQMFSPHSFSLGKAFRRYPLEGREISYD